MGKPRAEQGGPAAHPPPPSPPAPLSKRRGVGAAGGLLFPLAAALVGKLLLRRRRHGSAAGGGDVYAEPGERPRPVQLDWRALHCSLTRTSKGGESITTPLLANVSGVAAPGRLMAILGPSGAGKTCVVRPVSVR
jgi:hypothetical protein